MITNNTDTPMPFLFEGNRDEISNVHLSVVEGTMPNNIYGHVFLMTQCGTVNSGGYPFPKEINGKPNPEYGTPVLNGNGMIFVFDLSQQGKVIATSSIVKPPSYYADVATRIGGPARSEPEFENFHFNNAGISRMSFMLGAVNYANTAIIPVKFKNDSGASLLATYDTGRPIKLDPATLDFVTPLGYNNEWTQSMPRFLQAPFPMFETTAHPSWDAKEQVLYAVNFTKSSETELSRTFLYELLRRDKDHLESNLVKIARSFKKHESKEQAIKEIEELIKSGKQKAEPQKSKNFFSRLLDKIKSFFNSVIANKISELTDTVDQVLLVKFDGSGPLQTWKLVDEQNKSLVIYQCMHQTSLSENYILLMDSSFKFAFDLLINNPFPGNHEIDELIRLLSSKTILPSTRVWIVNKKDLGSNDTVVARLVKGQPIPGLSNEPYGGVPMECVHFSTEYTDTNDQLTIYTAHNNATCLAEWIRVYDVNYFTKKTYDSTNISNYAAGQLSLSSVGKYVIDGKTASFVPAESKIIREKGNLPPVSDLTGEPLKNVGPNTWGIGLYAYRNMISPTNTGSQIKQMYFVSFGTQPDLLTDYIKNLYTIVPNRILSLEDVLSYTKCGIPQSIISISTDDMTIEEHYEIEWGSYPMSIQFIPSKTPSITLPPDKDGYIWLTAKILKQVGEQYLYESQIWLFEAWNIAQGPVTKLAADDFNFCASLHITWMETAEAVTSGYMVDIKKDFDASIKNSFLEPIEMKPYHDFFEKYVYPNF